MTVIIDLRPETGAGLAAIAAEQGISLNEYVRRLLEEQVSGRRHRTLSPAERAAA
jgi:predicted HicB family RNase H-like nuclease